MSNNTTYFAKRSSKEMVDFVMSFESLSTLTDSQQGIGAVWLRNLRYYYSSLFGNSSSDTGLGFAGDQGELVQMLVPQARSLIGQFLSLTTKQRLNFEPQAESTDAITLADTRVASALSQQILKTQKFDDRAYNAAEMCVVTGAGYMYPRWNPLRGKPVAVDEEKGEIIYSGDNEITTPTCFDVAFDYMVQNWQDLDWVRIRIPQNKWDLVAKYPTLEKEILSLPLAYEDSSTQIVWQQNLSKDMVWTYEFIHRSSPALPQGRLAWFANSNCVFHDDVNPYIDTDEQAYIPVVQMKAESILGMGFGYPMMSNILPLQEMLDHQFSAISSNNVANAVQTILNPKGNDLSVADIGGLRFATYTPQNAEGGGKPEALQLTASAPESYKFADMIRSYMMEIANINGALRGQPPPGVTSGTAIATLTTNAIEFSQNFTKSYIEACERVMTYSLWNYRNFADESMIVSIAGPNETTIATAFKRDDLGAIKRVTCRVANPLMATAAGKFEIAQTLLQQGLIKNPKAYFKILEGAPIEELYDQDFSQEAFINSENDGLRKGKPEIVAILDDHAAHIAAHFSLLNDPEIRRRSDMVEHVMAHIMEHYKLSMQQDPILAQMVRTGQMPPMPPPMPGAPGPQQLPPGPELPPPDLSLDPNSGAASPAEPAVDISQMNLGEITPPLGAA